MNQREGFEDSAKIEFAYWQKQRRYPDIDTDMADNMSVRKSCRTVIESGILPKTSTRKGNKLPKQNIRTLTLTL